MSLPTIRTRARTGRVIHLSTADPKHSLPALNTFQFTETLCGKMIATTWVETSDTATCSTCVRNVPAEPEQPKRVNVVGLIMEYETGQATAEETLTLFGELIRTGQAWSLQGHYGRTATMYIDEGYLDEQGNRTELGDAFVADNDPQD